jgi:MFS family permease
MKREDEHGIFYGYFVVAAAFLIMVVMWTVFYAFGVFFKPILNEFGWSRAMTSGAFSLCSITMGLLGIAMGGLNDRFGPRMVMSVCGLLLGIGYLLMSQLEALWQLYLSFGLILGTGMGGGFVPLMTTVVRWFVLRRGMMTGIVTAGIGIGALIGPPIANGLISTHGWRISYIILGSIVLVVIVLSAQLLRRDPSQLGQLAYGENQSSRKGSNPRNGGLSLGEAIHTRPFWVLFAMIFCFGFGVFSIMVHIAAHATELGVSPAGAANILATIGGVSIIGKVLLGRAADIIGSRKVFLIGFSLMAAALFWLVPAKMAWMLYAFAVFFGFAYGGCVVAESPLVAVLFGLESHGLILGVIAFGFTVGGAFGPWLTGYIFDVTSSYQTAFLGCAVLSLLGLVLTAVLNPGRVDRKNEEEKEGHPRL